MSHRWLKFWPQDWESDVALRVVSLSAQGMWMRLICAMHRGEPYGHLTMNGQSLSMRQIAALASVTEKEAARLMAELQDAGVLSRTDEGVIYSRRMVRDNERSEEGREAISRRWAKKAIDNKPNMTPIRVGNSPLDSLETEAESEIERVLPFGQNSRARGPRADHPEPRGFAEFWNFYPVKVGKAAARKVWPRAVRAAGGDPEQIVIGLKARLHLFPEDSQYIPNPATWLNQGRWEDDPEALFARRQRSA